MMTHPDLEPLRRPELDLESSQKGQNDHFSQNRLILVEINPVFGPSEPKLADPDQKYPHFGGFSTPVLAMFSAIEAGPIGGFRIVSHVHLKLPLSKMKPVFFR